MLSAGCLQVVCRLFVGCQWFYEYEICYVENVTASILRNKFKNDIINKNGGK